MCLVAVLCVILKPLKKVDVSEVFRGAENDSGLCFRARGCFYRGKECGRRRT